MKLHWSPRSPFVRKVMIVLHETGLLDRVELMRNPVAMDQPNAVLMRDNPLSKIPTLVLDGGEMVCDSRVICEYLVSLAPGGGLFPAEASERFRALTWQALGDGLLDVLLLWRYWHRDRGLPPLSEGDAFLRAFALKTTATLDRLETLAPALSAGGFTIGHVSIGCVLSHLDFRWNELGWRTGRPRLAAWHEGFEARPSVRATRIVDDAPVAVASPSTGAA